jgi:acyl-coenzyme A synthetase/AMP-(fatty) acid ligase
VPESRRRLQGTLLNVNLWRRDEAPPAPGEPPAIALFTSDVGGDPKGILRGEHELRTVARAARETLGVVPDDRILCISPLHHGYAVDLGLVEALAHGATLHLEDEVDARQLERQLREQAITFFPGTPALYAGLARVVKSRPIETPGLRLLAGGAPLPEALAHAFADKYGVAIRGCYHITEAGPVTAQVPGRVSTAVGVAVAGMAVRLGAPGASDTGTTPGAVWLRSDAVSGTFLPALPATARVDVTPVGRIGLDGWFRTGDLGTQDSAGALTLHGREDDLVKVDGKRVALGEVAACLESFAKVKAAEARVVHDDLAGTMIVARVVLGGDCKADEIIDHCARTLPPHKVPRQVEICASLE